LFWIRAILGSLDGVLITGFSMVDQLDGPTHYNQAPERARPPPHAWLEEKKMFDRLVAR
jgi:hypothetical protein